MSPIRFFLSVITLLSAGTHALAAQDDLAGLANAGALHVGDDALYHDSVGMDLETFVPAAASSMVSELAGGLSSGLAGHSGLAELAELLRGDRGSVHAASGELRYPVHLYRLPGPVTDQATDLILTYRSYGTQNWMGPAFTADVSMDDPFGPGWHPSWLDLLQLVPTPLRGAGVVPRIVSGSAVVCVFEQADSLDESLLSDDSVGPVRTEIYRGGSERILCEIRGSQAERRETWCREFANGTRIVYGPTPDQRTLRPVRIFRGNIEDPLWSYTYRYADQRPPLAGSEEPEVARIPPSLVAPWLAIQELVDQRGIRVRFHWGDVGGGVQRVKSITVDHPQWTYAWGGLTTNFRYERVAPNRLTRIVGAPRDFVADLNRSGDYEPSEFFTNRSPVMRFTYGPGNLLDRVFDESGGVVRQRHRFTWDSTVYWRVRTQTAGDPAQPVPFPGQGARTHVFDYPSAFDMTWTDPRGIVRTYTHDDFGQQDPAQWQVTTIQRAIGPADPRPPGTNYPALTWQLTWDGNLSGLLETATLPSGRVLQFSWAFGLRLPVALTVYPSTAEPALTRSWSWSDWSHPDPRLRNRLETFTDRLGIPGQVDYYPDANGVTSEVKKNGVVVFRVREDNLGRALWQEEMSHAVDGGGTGEARINWEFGTNPSSTDYMLIRRRSRGAGPFETFLFEGPGFHVATIDATGQTTTYQRNVSDRVVQLTPPTAVGPNGQHTATVSLWHDLGGEQAIVSVPAFDQAGVNNPLPHGAIERRKIWDDFGRIWLVRQDITPLDEPGPTRWEVRTFTFDSSDRLVSVAIDDGQEYSYVFDDHDRLYQRSRKLDSVRSGSESFTWTEDGAPESHADGTGFLVAFEYDGYGRYERRSDSSGIEVVYAYDAENRSLREEIHGAGSLVRTHHFDRDAFGRVWNERVTSPLLAVTQSTLFDYTGLDRVARETYEDGRSTSFFFDALGRQIRASDDVDGLGTGNQEISVYDDLDREVERRLIVRIEDATGVSTQVDRRVYVPDAWGRVIRVDRYGDQNSVLASEDFGYLTTGALAFHRDSIGQVTSASFDALGRTRRVVVTPTDGSAPAVMTSDFVDDPVPADLGLLVLNTDAEGNVSETHFDLGGRLTEERHPGYSPAPRAMVWDYEYDDADRLTRWVDGNGTDVRVEYDSAKRVRRLWVPAPWSGLSDFATEVDYEYDELGREQRSRVWWGQFGTAGGPHPGAQLLVTVARAADAIERPLSESFGFLDDGAHLPLATKTVSSGWFLPGGGEDIEFRRSLTLPSGTALDYAPEGAGRVRSIGLTAPGLSFSDYATVLYAGNQLSETSTRVGLGVNKLHTRLGYDSLGMLATVTGRFGTGLGTDPLVYGLGVGRNLEGDVQTLVYAKVDGSAGDRMALDGFGRQREFKQGVPAAELFGPYAAATAARTVGYGYDRNHNREFSSVRLGGGPSLLGTYSLKPGSNQYEKAEGDEVECDGNGNVTRHGLYLYKYDFLDRLSEVEVLDPDSGATTTVGLYGHDSEHRRVIRFAAGALTYSVWDREDEVEQFDASFAPTTSFFHATDSASDQHLGFYRHVGPFPGLHAFVQDHQGSVVRIVDAAGATVERYEYEPYGSRHVYDASGTELGFSAFGNAYGFTGRVHDPESGLIYYRKRYYSPGLGRFLSSDRLGPWEDALNVGNEYAYVGSRPQTLVDPSGDIGLLCKIIPGKKKGLPGKGKGGKGGKGKGGKGDGPDGDGTTGNPRSGGGCRGGTAGGTAGSGTKGSGTKGSGSDGGGTKGGGDGKGGDGKGGAGGAAGGGAAGGAGSGAGGGAGGGGAGSGGVVKEITIDGDKYPESAKHLEDAGVVGKPLTVDRGGATKRRREALKGIEPIPGFDRDECPPAVFKEGGAGASVRPVPPGDNRGAGASIGGQLKGVKDGEKVVIKVVRDGK